MEQQRNTQITPCFKIQFPGDDTAKTVIQGKLQTVRGHLTKIRSNNVTNSDILNAVLDFWMQKNEEPMQEAPSSYLTSRVKETNQDLFTTASKSLQNIVNLTHHHSRFCKGAPKIKKLIRRGHVMVATFKCSNQEDSHTNSWSSSPYLPNKEYLVNHRICHAIVFCGMLPVHYTRFSNSWNWMYIQRETEEF